MLKVFARAIVAASVLFTTAANAAWPERTVTLIAPYPAGGLTDVMARLVASELQAKYKQTFIVQNDVGAGGTIGTANVAKATPDGYTLFFGPIGLLTLSPMTTKVRYDPERDFVPISIVGATPFVVTVTESFPAKTLAEFITEVKKKPDGYSYASAGAGSTTHAASVLFLKTAGLKMVHVPYRGVGPSFTALVAGNIEMSSVSPVELKPFIDSPKVRPLGISSKERSRHLPNVPTISETLPSPYVATYNGLMAPKGTPKEIVDMLSKAAQEAVKNEGFSEKLLRAGLEPVGSTPEDMLKAIAEDKKNWLTVKDDILASMGAK